MHRSAYQRLVRPLRDRRIEAAWVARGRPVPPPGAVKRRLIVADLRRHRPEVFVETGTALGDTAAAAALHVGRVYTVELDPVLARAAREHRV